MVYGLGNRDGGRDLPETLVALPATSPHLRAAPNRAHCHPSDQVLLLFLFIP